MAKFHEVLILIPCHSLEDFPTDLGEEEAEGLLNAFSISWHPALIAECGGLPRWSRADEPPLHVENQLFVIPPVCEGWMPHEWAENARASGALVIDKARTREEYRAAIEELFPDEATKTAQRVEDFFALGFCWLMIELLTRKMHYYSSVDEGSFERDGVAAARAALAADETATQAHLKGCFETLLESREHFYPVDCYLVDVCLLQPETVDEHLIETLDAGIPLNFLVKADDLEPIAQAHPAEFARLQEAVKSGQADLVGGDFIEKPLSLLPLQSVLWDLKRGREAYEAHFGKSPRTWGRKRFGFSTLLPQILDRFGYHSALHVALDDGIYPDEEQSKFRWEGCDGTLIDAVSRIPLAADGAGSYLRLPDRMAESMQDDQVAGLFFARWPELKGVWFQDLRRINSYCPVLGKFVTFDDFIETTDHSGRLAIHSEAEYLTPYYLQAVAFGEADAISRFIQFIHDRHRFERTAWISGLLSILKNEPIAPDRLREAEDQLELSGPDLPGENFSREDFEQNQSELEQNSVRSLAQLIVAQNGSSRGVLAINTLAHPRFVAVPLAKFSHPPEIDGPVKAIQFDENHREAIVELAGSGFAWIPEGTQPAETKSNFVPSAEDFVLRNESFEVLINEKTGGIQHLKNYGRSPNRLSQQLAFRFSRERTFEIPDDPPREVVSQYSEMQLKSSEVTCAGPTLGEIVTHSEIVDQEQNEVLAECVQTFRVRRGLPVVELEIEIVPQKLPDTDPWNCYFASRFAWNDEGAALTRGLLQSAFGIQGDRIESPYYLEIASGERRTTILFDGLPFHRKTGPRMVDSILISEGESARKFRFQIAVDQDYPMKSAMELLNPPVLYSMETGPAELAQGWFFHLKQKNIQILGIEPLMAQPDSETQAGFGFALRLLETEGRSRKCKLRMFRTPSSARKRDFVGKTLAELAIQNESVLFELNPHELVDVEFCFAS